MRFLSEETVERAFDYVLDVLESVGIVFEKDQALDIFVQRGFKVEGNKVFMRPETVLGLLIHDFAIGVAGLVYVKLRDPEVFVSFSESSGITDMRSMQPCYGVAENIKFKVDFTSFANMRGFLALLRGPLVILVWLITKVGLRLCLLPCYHILQRRLIGCGATLDTWGLTLVEALRRLF